jgi:putative colanic acid biosynthesis acetyltransferase WcaF
MKPNIKIKFPWKLKIGDHTWIGEGVWIDNLACVNIGDNVCISQGVFICAGSHDWSRIGFDLITRDIKISDQVWIGAKSSVVLGTEIGEGTVVTMDGLASGKLRPWSIYSGRPATFLKPRPRYYGSAV